MTTEDSENLVAAISERVREALLEAERRGNEFVEEAERRANEIIAEAEGRAGQIRAQAEAEASRRIATAEEQARERIDRARQALEELGVTLSATPEPADLQEDDDVEDPDEDDELDADEVEDEDFDEDDEDDEEELQPVAEDEPEPAEEPAPPADGPSTEELIAQLRSGATGASGAPADTGGDAAARLVAMNMALDGASRDEIERHLAEGYEVADRDALLDEVFSRVSS